MSRSGTEETRTITPSVIDAFIRWHNPAHVGHGWISDGEDNTLTCQCGVLLAHATDEAPFPGLAYEGQSDE